MMRLSRLVRSISLAALILAGLMMTGCEAIGFGIHSLRPEYTNVEVKAEYLDLAGKSIAVMVIADDATKFNFPDAAYKVTQHVTSHLSVNLPSVKPISPEDIIAYQKKNSHWITLPYGDLVKALKVERLVLISLTNYSVNEPGNRHVWRGTIAARVNVAEVDATNPDNFVYSTDMQVVYPTDKGIGLLNSDRETIELGMLKMFAQQTSHLFYDHTIQRKN